MEPQDTVLVLADISGYTRFTRLRALSLVHAEQIITDLLEAVIDQAQYPLQVSKIEGDAVFLYAAAGDNPAAAAHDVVGQVMRFFDAFQAKARHLIEVTMCPCQACGGIDQLKLKVILHIGPVLTKRVRQFEELAGEPVILLHRLAKNSVAAREYILVTETFYALSGPWPGHTPEARVESPEGFEPVPVRVFYPGAAGMAAPDRPRPPLGRRLAHFVRVNFESVLRLVGLRPRAALGNGPF